jgi:hypothetical protein
LPITVFSVHHPDLITKATESGNKRDWDAGYNSIYPVRKFSKFETNNENGWRIIQVYVLGSEMHMSEDSELFSATRYDCLTQVLF